MFTEANQTLFQGCVTDTMQGRIQDFPSGGRGPILGGFWPPTWALFSENVCENKRIGSCRGGMHQHAPLDPPMLCVTQQISYTWTPGDHHLQSSMQEHSQLFVKGWPKPKILDLFADSVQWSHKN